MSQPNLAEQQPAEMAPQQPAAPSANLQKQRLNVYTMMLVLSFFAIVTACLLLYYELKKYGDYPWWNTNEARPAGGGGPTAMFHPEENRLYPSVVKIEQA